MAVVGSSVLGGLVDGLFRVESISVKVLLRTDFLLGRDSIRLNHRVILTVYSGIDSDVENTISLSVFFTGDALNVCLLLMVVRNHSIGDLCTPLASLFIWRQDVL